MSADRRFDRIAFGIITFGVCLRLRAYLYDRSLWFDELQLIETLGKPVIARCLHPLREGQVAPAGFVAIVQLLRRLFSSSELVLRMPSIAAGIASLPLFWLLVKRVLSPAAALLALAMLSLSPEAIFLAADFKPYSSDLFLALALLVVSIPLFSRPSPRDAVVFTLVGLTGVLCSLPFVLVLGAVFGAIVLAKWRSARDELVRRILPLFVLFFVVFGLEYALLLAPQRTNSGLQEYWTKAGALPKAGDFLARLSWIPGSLSTALADPLGIGGDGRLHASIEIIGSVLVLIGVVSLLRARRTHPERTMFAFALAVAWFAAFVRAYPFGGRVLLFLAPVLAILVASGFESAMRWIRAPRLLASVAAVLWLVPAARDAGLTFLHPKEVEESRSVLTRMRERIREGDVVYVEWWSHFAYDYYAKQLGLDSVRSVRAERVETEDIEDFATDARSKVAGVPRVWWFTAHFVPRLPPNDRVLEVFASAGLRAIESEPVVVATGVRAQLLDGSGVH